MNSSTVRLPAPASRSRSRSRAATSPVHAPAPQPEAILFTPPSRTKVLELPEKLRPRAEVLAASLTADFAHSAARATLARITQVAQENCVRAKPDEEGPGWTALTVEKRAARALRRTFPPNAHGAKEKSACPPARLAVSAPVMPRDALMRPVVGNAWSGEHYWQPQFSSSLPESPAAESEGEAQAVHSDPVRRAVYESVQADMELCVRELKAEAFARGERISDVEAEVVAAMTVLDEKNLAYEAAYELPVPKDIVTRTREFGEAQTEAVAKYTIEDEKTLEDSGTWLQVGEETAHVTTPLDYARASLKIAGENRKSAELELCGPGLSLVYAVHILDEKIRRLENRGSYEESSDDEMLEYGKFLKSIQEEQRIGEENRRPRESVGEATIRMRRMKGKAPSTLDLETWADELKGLSPEKKRSER
ncbi:hypothetical protein BU23DRAFT_93820 [Bimuria novae-zelandiae CBS 107.79]|uniref:Uncharacterized protein n=1 Tax=Bimuria novae-zelandiae CBS 107.79 TaxID=1447943 RepID=A0A6A5VBE1_9PLEO|nr:hypothetical protein BU23DRAFT_93820 [Bimuria novae-zelandiae CBS 107.79]